MIPRRSTPVKNEVLIEVFAKGRLTQTEMRIASYIMRWSWGFDEGDRRQEWTREISISRMSEEIEMDKGNCSKTVNKMLKEGKLSKRGRRYHFNERYEEWGRVVKSTTSEEPQKVVKSTTPGVPEKVVKSTTKGCKIYNKKLLNLQLSPRAKQDADSPPSPLKETYKETLKKSTTATNEKTKAEDKEIKAEKTQEEVKTEKAGAEKAPEGLKAKTPDKNKNAEAVKTSEELRAVKTPNKRRDAREPEVVKPQEEGKGESKKEKIAFDPSSGRLTHISAEFAGRLKEAFPHLDVEEEIRKAELWLYANPAKRKSNYERFLINWLSRAEASHAEVSRAEASHKGRAEGGRGGKNGRYIAVSNAPKSRADRGAPFAARAGEW